MKALVPLADGVEEMEAVIIIDTLRRARWEVTPVSITGEKTITASRGVVLVADAIWEQLDPSDYDLLILPGGLGGTEALTAHAGVQEAIRVFLASGRTVAAICAAALALQAAGVLEGRRVTCHPSVANRLTATSRTTARVEIDGDLITSQGPGTAFEFALTLVRELDSAAVADEVAAGLIL